MQRRMEKVGMAGGLLPASWFMLRACSGSDCQGLSCASCAAEEPEGALGQSWRWRVLRADVLPACGSTIIAPNQASQLSGAAEIRMWSAADAAQQRPRQHSNSVKAEDEPGSSAPHEGVHVQFML